MTTFDHPGLLYREPGGFLDGTVPFVRAAVEAGDPVLVALPGDHLGLLRDALDGVAGRVVFADMATAGRNPGRILPSVLLPFAAAHAGHRVSIVGEPVWAGRTEAERPACAQHEALINAAFAGADASILCPYDEAALGPAAIADAWRTHPVMISRGDRMPSPWYDGDPIATAEAVNAALPPPPAEAESVGYEGLRDLSVVRSFVRRRAAAVLGPDRTQGMVLAMHELATNTIKHAGGPGRVTVWTEPGRIVCQVDDRGHITDPLAGRRLPPPLSPCGRGLLMVNQVCDLVRVCTGPAGTTVRVHMAFDQGLSCRSVAS
ncbi:anti-sigma factor RsbA family regulatory protein [Paractinoplanes rhizophilus]|uniref:Anti-sigma factor RsbA family regulatory protein n=1 Tax=Paractinoplanes rhizophilus TaxID=1416877 RepID=A0ABW2HXV5_9ACTN|nr:sensor histidine kinase [Actinoplanes sp.]